MVAIGQRPFLEIFISLPFFPKNLKDDGDGKSRIPRGQRTPFQHQQMFADWHHG
jgi:hypothetical protein